MRGRTQQSTPPPAAEAFTSDAPLPEPTGPEDDRFVYHLEPKALQLLAEHAATYGDGDGDASGVPLARPVARTSAVQEAIDEEATRNRRRRRRRAARDRGRRFATVSYLERGGRRLPYIRLSGQWLRQAGFDLGQEFEIDVAPGRLTLHAFPD
jgi:hypothetical protein